MGTDYTILYKTYYHILVKYAVAIVGRTEDAENITQDVFLMLLERPEIIPCVENIKFYLLKLTRNRCYDYIKHKECERNYAERIISYGISSGILYGSRLPEVYENLDHEEAKILIRKSILKLPEKCRKIFLMHRKEGLKYSEISNELNISVNTVENQMGIAIRKLRSDYNIAQVS